MYVRGYLQGSENGRVVTIDRNTDEVWWRYGISRSCDECINGILRLIVLTTWYLLTSICVDNLVSSDVYLCWQLGIFLRLIVLTTWYLLTSICVDNLVSSDVYLCWQLGIFWRLFDICLICRLNSLAYLQCKSVVEYFYFFCLDDNWA